MALVQAHSRMQPSKNFIAPVDEGGGGGGYDTDAQAFIDVLTSPSTTLQDAIDTLVVKLKADGVWNDLYALYPMCNGTATDHKWNLVNPADTDAAWRITFYGGWTHNSDGAKGNGSTAWGDTHFYPKDDWISYNSCTIFYYSGTNETATSVEMGEDNYYGSYYPRTIMSLKTNYFTPPDTMYVDMHKYTTSRVLGAVSDSRGVFVASRTTQYLIEIYQDGTSLGTSTGDGGSQASPYSADPIALNCVRDHGTTSFAHSAKLVKGAGFAKGLTATQVSDLTDALTAFNTTIR